jgi:predicted secreted protein
MAKKLGNDYRLWIESSTPGTYNEIMGQQDLSVERQGATIDLSSKDDFPYAAQGAGMRTVNIQCTMLPDLPDADGFTRLETQANTTVATPFNIQVRKGGSAGSGADVVYEGSVYATNFNTNFAQNGGVACSVTFVAAAAPTTDELA